MDSPVWTTFHEIGPSLGLYILVVGGIFDIHTDFFVAAAGPDGANSPKFAVTLMHAF
jgi:hypothetical protein